MGFSDQLGLEVIEKIRSWSPMPIIVLNERPMEDQRLAAFELGADDCVSKPFSSAELVARVRAAVRRTVLVTESRFWWRWWSAGEVSTGRLVPNPEVFTRTTLWLWVVVVVPVVTTILINLLFGPSAAAMAERGVGTSSQSSRPR
jgi:hypothetical protein